MIYILYTSLTLKDAIQSGPLTWLEVRNVIWGVEVNVFLQRLRSLWWWCMDLLRGSELSAGLWMFSSASQGTDGVKKGILGGNSAPGSDVFHRLNVRMFHSSRRVSHVITGHTHRNNCTYSIQITLADIKHCLVKINHNTFSCLVLSTSRVSRGNIRLF